MATESPHYSTSYAAALVLIETLVTMVVREAGRGGWVHVSENWYESEMCHVWKFDLLRFCTYVE